MLYHRCSKDMLPAFINMTWDIAQLGTPNPSYDSFPTVERYSCQFHKYDSETYEWSCSFAFRDSEIVVEIEVQTLKSVSSDIC